MQQQALNGWLALQKKMGKGTGKHVGRLREEAKKTLAECRQAVPVWIMRKRPTNRIFHRDELARTIRSRKGAVSWHGGIRKSSVGGGD